VASFGVPSLEDAWGAPSQLYNAIKYEMSAVINDERAAQPSWTLGTRRLATQTSLF